MNVVELSRMMIECMNWTVGMSTDLRTLTVQTSSSPASNVFSHGRPDIAIRY